MSRCSGCLQQRFLDNLMNIQATHDNEWTGLRDAMSALHSLARETESAV